MAIIKSVHSNASVNTAVKYIERSCKTAAGLITGLNCSPESAASEMMTTKRIWGKTTGRSYDHYVQSFSPEENVSHEEAHAIAVEWAEKEFTGFEVVVATHTDTKHLHSHILVNSVSYIDGHKIHTSAAWLDQAKHDSDEICWAHGLTITRKGYDFDGYIRTSPTIWKKDAFHLMERARRGEIASYVYDIYVKVSDARARSTSQEEYINNLSSQGISVCWSDTRRDITYADTSGHRIRSSRLEKITGIPQDKANLELDFQRTHHHCR